LSVRSRTEIQLKCQVSTANPCAAQRIPGCRKGMAGRATRSLVSIFAMNVTQIDDEEAEPVEMKIELEKEAAG
jgi:hypothetical protein